MELRQLEYFRVIAETESIHEAARRLNMSQPPLSYQLKQLEAELNVTLFERTRQGVRLTEAGKLLYDRSANLLEYVKSTELEVAKVGKKRVLRLGITPTTVATIMPCVSLFSRRNPDVNFEVHDGITYTLYRYLMDGIIDISIARTPLRLDDVDYKILSSEPMIAVSSTETVMHVFIASAGIFVACMFPIHRFLYLFSTSHGLFSIPLRHTRNLSLPKTSSGKCSNRTGCSLLS